MDLEAAGEKKITNCLESGQIFAKRYPFSVDIQGPGKGGLDLCFL